MPWMSVTDTNLREHVVNVDNISHFTSLGDGSLMELKTGMSLYLTDSYESLKEVVLQADAKKAK